MKKPLTLEEFARLGGHARAATLTPAKRRAIGRKAARTRWGPKKKVAASK